MDTAITDLQWLKVKFRIAYKVLLMVHNCTRGNAPDEIKSSLLTTNSSRTNTLKQAKYCNKYGYRSFSFTGPRLWNMLPGYVRGVEETANFKKLLKHL